uniref:RING-type domain-containing protein n=1 Tax=Globodera rostochiensis TaxID=31243 RepID=A0A914HVE5_GLORO
MKSYGTSKVWRPNGSAQTAATKRRRPNVSAQTSRSRHDEVRRVFGAASLNRELVTIGRAVKMGNRRHAGPLCMDTMQNLRECDQNDPKAFIQITDSLSRVMKQFEYEKSELCCHGNIYIECVRASNYINLRIPQHLFLHYNEFNYDIRSRTIEPVEVGVNASTGQNEISNSEPVEVGVNASTGQNEVSTSSVQSGDVHGISPTNNHLPSTDSEEKFNLSPCAICFDKPREITFIPCGHLACCRQCADIIKNFCPMCRGKIEGKQLTYL